MREPCCATVDRAIETGGFVIRIQTGKNVGGLDFRFARPNPHGGFRRSRKEKVP